MHLSRLTRRPLRGVVRGAAATAALVASLGATVALAAPSDAAATAARTAKPAAAAAITSCTGSDVKVTAKTEPGQRLLLTATNAGKRNCFAYGYPYLRFGDAQAAPGYIAASVPQAVVTLAPHQSAYALVHTSSSGAHHNHGVHTLEVFFANAADRGSVGAGAHVALPKAGVRVDDSVRTTYWQSTARLALRW
ncbi:DUF4232 domain-containing protein [Streptacidiphilus melanogenes]|uniref:DUF4232 domain-containing protein n=1 Tax=Streptacidiphilus melanogenes TaxID=411235 RepID=UPI000A024B99|nr:DUF4232 domain-containing protein [Streptacidiphilus melanogenes]